jgi:hypothetical protein
MRHPQRRRWPPWLVAILVFLLVNAIGLVLLITVVSNNDAAIDRFIRGIGSSSLFFAVVAYLIQRKRLLDG